jgi:Flp pilus assembly protein protease CpaA
MMLYFLTISILSIATFTDLKERRIPNWLTYGGIVIAVVLIFINQPVMWYHLIGLIPAIAMFILKLWKNEFGGGDIKLALFLGLALGGIAPTFIFGFCFVLILIYKIVQMFVAIGSEAIPMAPFFLLATIIVFLIDALAYNFII